MSDRTTRPANRTSARACPVCGKPASVADTPFCTDRCRQVDLGRWLTGSYRIPARDDDAEDEA